MSKFNSIITQKLIENKERLQKDFQENEKKVGTRFFYIDDLLPLELANEIYQAFPKDSSQWREMSSFREKKLTSKNFDSLPEILRDITFAVQSPEVLKIVEEITGMSYLDPDSSLYAGGLSMMREGDFLNPHIDNSHDHNRKKYRRLNLLYYVTPNWIRENGGHLELWDLKVKKNEIIESRFNRLAVMETNNKSWHSVSKVVRSGGYRCCVSNYYFSPISPLGHDYFHITAFKGRPDEPIRRLLSDVDSVLRSGLRMIKRNGLGKEDLYKGSKE